ncbi:MAG: hypothetical protein M1817_006525 [Caeruleum heppii]|nr:MAG: hypothetical protein M1817_006525 [Caeruleum heppii]
MGKRKKAAKKPTGPRRREPLATTFPCLFCNHEKSVAVQLDKKAGAGHLSCKVCGQTFQTGINYLSAAVDVYSDWIDACDTVARDDARDAQRRGTATVARQLAVPTQPGDLSQPNEYEAEDEEDLDDAHGEAAYADE